MRALNARVCVRGNPRPQLAGCRPRSHPRPAPVNPSLRPSLTPPPLRSYKSCARRRPPYSQGARPSREVAPLSPTQSHSAHSHTWKRLPTSLPCPPLAPLFPLSPRTVADRLPIRLSLSPSLHNMTAWEAVAQAEQQEDY